MAQEQKPRPPAGLPLANELEGIRVEHVRRVELVRRRIDLLGASLGQPEVVRGVILIVRMVARVTVELVKPALDRPGRLVHVPLANVVTTVPGGLQHFGQRHALFVQSPEMPRPASRTGLSRREIRNARLRRIQPGHQRCAARAAPRRVVDLREPHAAPGQGVDVRRGDLAAVASQVRVAEVVGKDYYDVWYTANRIIFAVLVRAYRQFC